MAAIPTIRSPPGDVFLSPETDATIAAVPGGNLDGGFIYEFHGPECKKPRQFDEASSV
jgi:hypothetical protein